MDRVIAEFPSRQLDADLVICDYPGIAYQEDMSKSVPYDDAYFDRYVGYEGSEIEQALNRCRLNLVAQARGMEVIDVGIGSGKFLQAAQAAGLKCSGYDVNPRAEAWLKERDLWLDIYNPGPPTFYQGGTVCWTFWDVLEHIPEPHKILDKIPVGHCLLTSIPIFADLSRVRESKHFRPDEHYYYFTDEGFRRWMQRYRFLCTAWNDDESTAR